MSVTDHSMEGDIEHRVREMLRRRANDIEDVVRPLPNLDRAVTSNGSHRAAGATGGSSASGPPWHRGPRRPLLVAAAVVVVLGLGGGVGVALRGVRSLDTAIDVATVDVDPLADPATTPGADPAREGIVRDLAAVVASLPSGLDLATGPPVFDATDVVGDDPAPLALATAYLADRLPDFEPELTLVDQTAEDDPTLTLYRWRVDQADLEATGELVVRSKGERTTAVPGVVLALTDGVELTEVARTVERLRVVADASTSGFDEPLEATLWTVRGEALGATTEPAGGDGAIEGVDLPPQPVVVRYQHVGGTSLTITELVVDAVGFARSCGSIAPVSISIEGYQGALEPGPGPGTTAPLLENQAGWHYPVDPAIELRWPASPSLAVRVPADLIGDRVAGAITPGDGSISPDGAGLEGEVSGHALLAVDVDPHDPCSLLEVTIRGEAAAVEVWSQALTAQWTFRQPLLVEPLESPPGADDGVPAPGPLVGATEDGGTPPTVPLTGSCDGLPDAPPLKGAGDGSIHPDPETALARFLTRWEEAGNGGLPREGYLEFPVDDDTRVYVIHGHSSTEATIRVEVERQELGWQVGTWSMAAC